MKLKLPERLLVNNPVRGAMLRVTVEWLWRAAEAPQLGRVLEIGCGRGDGVCEIARRFRPGAIDAFDLDPAQVRRAQHRLHRAGGPAARLFIGDAERIDAPDASYDAVFAFTILHHVPGWPAALSEVGRVLRPEGLFLFEELTRDTFYETPRAGALLRRLTAHPWDRMFTTAELRRGLEEAGLRVLVWNEARVPGWCRGVAQRTGPGDDGVGPPRDRPLQRFVQEPGADG